MTIFLKISAIYFGSLPITIALIVLLSAAQAAWGWIKRKSFSGLRDTLKSTDACLETPII